jgi:hypothetical protein
MKVARSTPSSALQEKKILPLQQKAQLLVLYCYEEAPKQGFWSRSNEGKTERGLLKGMCSLTIKKKWTDKQKGARKRKTLLNETDELDRSSVGVQLGTMVEGRCCPYW